MKNKILYTIVIVVLIAIIGYLILDLLNIQLFHSAASSGADFCK